MTGTVAVLTDVALQGLSAAAAPACCRAQRVWYQPVANQL
jgi:hypothetical protein